MEKRDANFEKELITFDSDKKLFHLRGLDTSYALQVVNEGYLAHLYWGKRVNSYNLSNAIQFIDRPFSPNPNPRTWGFSLDTIPQEYPSYGNTDFRAPAYQIQLENGTTITDLRYKSHKISKGKPKLQGLPAVYVESDDEAETLEVELEDTVIGFTAYLSYTVYRNLNVITRSVRFVNNGDKKLKILKAASMSVDFRDSNYDMLHLSGSWARERYIDRKPLNLGTQSIESRRGASGHQQNPFVALLRKDTNEDFGEVFAFNLVYSGNFKAEVEVDQFKSTRVSFGINPFDFSWLLDSGECFQTPEVVMVYSSRGLGEMSRTFHKLYRNRLCRGKYKNAPRPILINNWEATYFNFNAEKLEKIAATAKKLGIELFVLDDGWFGKRNDDTTSLGDWFVNKEKLPAGLNDLAGRINKLGMKFGLWFEPEMISENSELYKKHPDWCLHVPDRHRSTGRTQLVLDFSRQDVRDEIVKMLSDILGNAPISYVKWDMNRHMTEVGSELLPAERQRETAHRYMLGLYDVLERITSSFPEVLFESCSGGGGRFDAGMLYYMPQTWTSDNTDAVSRLKIQYGTSLVYPTSAMGSHVSAVPNHQVGRITPIETRGNVAMSGTLGYELDLNKLPVEEQEIVKQQVGLYKEMRDVIQYGDFYRLLSPFEGNNTAWMFVSEDKKEAYVFYFKVLAEPNDAVDTLKLKGLNPDFNYEVDQTGHKFGGDELMYIGMNVPIKNSDFQSVLIKLAMV